MLNPSKLALALAGAYFLTAPETFAQTVEPDTADDIDEVIVVSASQTERQWQTTPAAVDRVSEREQLPGPRIDSAELLGGIPGLQADSRANYAQDSRIVMRGYGARSAFGVRGVLLSLDGVPLSMPDGQAQTSSILLDEADHVEVLRGPLAALYGNGAGGFIEWRSDAPQESAITANLMAGSNQLRRGLLQGDWVSEDGDQALRITGTKFETDGPRAHNSAEREQIGLRWYQNVSDTTRLVLRYDDNNAPLLQDPGALTPEAFAEDATQTFGGATTFNTRKDIRHRQGSLSLQNERWQVTAWQGKREIEQYLPFPGDEPNSSGAVIDLAREFKGINARYTFDISDTFALTVGAEHEQQDDDRLGFANDFGVKGVLRRDELGEVDVTDVFAIGEWQLNERWQVIAGTRWTDLEFRVSDNYITDASPDDSGARDDSNLAWSAGVNYQLNDEWSWFAAVGSSFAAPTLTEMAYQSDGSGLNLALQPSSDKQIDIGMKWQRNTSRLAVTVFAVDSDDEILVDTSLDGRTTYANAGATERFGLEISGSLQHNDWLSSRFAVTGIDATFSAANDSQLNGARLPGIAEYSVYWQVDGELPWRIGRSSPLMLSFVTDYRSDIAATDNNAVVAPSRTVFHAALQTQWELPQWQIVPWLRIDNLTDKTYVGSVVVNQGNGRAFEPGVGRTWSAGLEFKRRF